MRPNKLHVDVTKKDKERPAALAKGGRDSMFPKQSVGPAPRGHTGKPQPAPAGAKSAKGGVVESKPRSAKPAPAGRTGSR